VLQVWTVVVVVAVVVILVTVAVASPSGIACIRAITHKTLRNCYTSLLSVDSHFTGFKVGKWLSLSKSLPCCVIFGLCCDNTDTTEAQVVLHGSLWLVMSCSDTLMWIGLMLTFRRLISNLLKMFEIWRYEGSWFCCLSCKPKDSVCLCRSCSMWVADLDGSNYVCRVVGLWGNIMPDKCYHKVCVLSLLCGITFNALIFY